jgi:hypothetical protein
MSTNIYNRITFSLFVPGTLRLVGGVYTVDMISVPINGPLNHAGSGYYYLSASDINLGFSFDYEEIDNPVSNIEPPKVVNVSSLVVSSITFSAIYMNFFDYWINDFEVNFDEINLTLKEEIDELLEKKEDIAKLLTEELNQLLNVISCIYINIINFAINECIFFRQ